MGRLENIVARNRRGQRPRERLVVSLGFSAFVLLILILLLFTDLNVPAGSQQAAPTQPAIERTGKHVDGVLLGPRRPAASPGDVPVPSRPAEPADSPHRASRRADEPSAPAAEK